MLKILLAAGLVVIVLLLFFVLMMFGLVLLMSFIIFTTRDDPEARVAVPRRSVITPTQDDMLFSRLAREGMAYATRPYVSTVIHTEGDALVTTISDAYRRRVYVESKRRVSKTLLTVICVYEDGRDVPSVEVSMEIPATQVDWPAHFNAVSDITVHGPRMSFTDQYGRRREIRIPTRRTYHA